MDILPKEYQVCTGSSDVWRIIWETFENASMTYDLAASSPATTNSRWNGTRFSNNYDENNDSYLSPAKLGIVTGLLILSLFTEPRLIPYKIDNCFESTIKSIAFIVLNISCSLIIAPFILLTLTIFSIYRKLIEITLKLKIGKNFGGLLEGTDCVWAVEDAPSLSVINILGILELKNPDKKAHNSIDSKNYENLKNYENHGILNDFRTLVNDRLLTPNFEKLSWTREKKYGYYFWKKSDNIKLEKHVRLLDEQNHENCDGKCDDVYGKYLKQLITEASNKPLPESHSTCWEILIGNVCKKNRCLNRNSNDTKNVVPILFRVHHSLGDGVALLRLLLEALADKRDQEIFLEKKISIDPTKIDQNLTDLQKLKIPTIVQRASFSGSLMESPEIIYYSADFLSASMPFAKIISIRRELKRMTHVKNILFDWLNCMRSITGEEMKMFVNVQAKFVGKLVMRALIYGKTVLEKIVRVGVAFILLPSFLVRQAIRSMDESAIHGPLLTGSKVISCWMEDDYKEKNDTKYLLERIRDIKNITGARFGDVVLAALSTNLHKYFNQIKKGVPKTVTVVIPARMTAPSQKLVLKNGFSVGLLPLCVSEINGKEYHCPPNNDDMDPWKIFDRLRDVSESSRKLRNDPDYLINYWVMNYLAAALPEFLLRPLLFSRSTLVFSNLPGPRAIKISGNLLKKVAFWIPHRGTTGIGCAFLTYNGNVHFSIVADKAVISDEKILDEIIKGTINDIKQLHEKIKSSKNYFSKNKF